MNLAEDLGEAKKLQTNAFRRRVIESLTAADVPEVLADGIADVLAEAGFKRLSTSPSQTVSAAPVLVPTVNCIKSTIPSFLRFNSIIETLPTLVLRHDQRIGQLTQKRQHNMYAYARLAADSRRADVLMLTPQDRIA